MAIDPTIRDQAYQFFIEEAPELLHQIESGLLCLSQERSVAQVHTLMRSAHSLKGGAASVGLDTIATLAHRLENIFKALYSDRLVVDAQLESQLLQAYDCLRLPLMEQIAQGYFNADQALSIAEPILTQIEQQCGDALSQTESYIPSSSELGVDLVVSIFEVDVAQGLERLAMVLEQPQQYQVAEELRAQVEVFAGFAELLSLPGFGAVVGMVQQALTQSPDRALEIAQLALAEFERSRQAILAGDRTLSSVSPGLVALAQEAQIPDVALQPSELEAKIADPEVSPIEAALPFLESIFGDVAFDDPALDRLAGLADLTGLADFTDFTDFTAASAIELPAIDAIAARESDIDGLEVELRESAQDTEVGEDWEDGEDEEIGAIVAEMVTEELIAEEPITTEPIVESTLVKADSLLPASLGQFPLPPTELHYSTRTRFYSGAEVPPPIEPPATNLTVRVDAERLERMNNLTGELMINRDGLALQNEQLQGVLRELLNRFERFQKLTHQFRNLADQTLTETDRSPQPEKQEAAVAGTAGNGQSGVATLSTFNPMVSSSVLMEFDTLEMDDYGALHFQIQEILEDVVQLEEAVEDITLFARQSNQILDQQRQTLNSLQNEVKWARMLPLGEVLNRFPRLLRDLSNTYGKSVNLKLTGTDILVDKAILEKLYDPLLHLLRNAFDHGIESPVLRQQQGKPEQGQIEIRAYHKGNQTMIEVRDDGQGLNLDRIRHRAFELGWLPAHQLLVTPVDRLLDFIFAPGFSTAHQVSELSGRGVGLDVVRAQLAAIKGSISVDSAPGQGTTFTLHLPLTLTIARLIIGMVGSTAFAISADSVEEIITPAVDQIRQSGRQRFLYWREQIIPIHHLATLLHYTCPIPEVPPSRALSAIATPADWEPPLLLLRQEQGFVALEVDRLVNEQELVIKPFGSAVAPPPYIYGCTILGDGRLVPVMDALALLGWNQDSMQSTSGSRLNAQDTADAVRPTAPTIPTLQTPTILVVDDAITVRRTLALSLEREGFRVLQARDGWEAIDQLQQSTLVQLVICDIEMPNMNGFEFLSYRRQTPELADVPVVMLTSRSNEKHRWLALQLGALDYFTKPYLEQEFLAAIKGIVRSKG